MSEATHLPLDLLQTFVKVVEHDGDASAAGDALGISQPTMSKRLSGLRRLVEEDGGEAWLLLKGKRWLLTAEGERVRGVVVELVMHYERVQLFVADARPAQTSLSIASGQTAASSFVQEAVAGLLSEFPDVQVRISTPRGADRIAGVATGQFDIAIVTDSDAAIRETAGIDMYIQSLFLDRFVVVGHPSARAKWAKSWERLPERRPLRASELLDFPFVLPEPDAYRRQQFDRWFVRANQRMPQVILEVGGWLGLLQFVQQGVGVGFATEGAVSAYKALRGGTSRGGFTSRLLDQEEFPPDDVRLIARKQSGIDEPQLSGPAYRLLELLRAAAQTKQ